MIRFIGTMRGVKIDSKVDTGDNTIIHTITLKLEITEGVDRVQEITERLKEIVQVEIDPKQPRLPGAR